MDSTSVWLVLKALHEAARRVKTRCPGVTVEASGGLTEQNIVEFLGRDVDVVSLGCATHRPDAVNYSLKIRAPGRDPTNPTVTSDDTHH